MTGILAAAKDRILTSDIRLVATRRTQTENVFTLTSRFSPERGVVTAVIAFLSYRLWPPSGESIASFVPAVALGVAGVMIGVAVRELSFNRRSGLSISRFRSLGLVLERQEELQGAGAVRLQSERFAEGAPGWQFLVVCDGSTHGRILSLRYCASLELARQFAAFLSLPVLDETSDDSRGYQPRG